VNRGWQDLWNRVCSPQVWLKLVGHSCPLQVSPRDCLHDDHSQPTNCQPASSRPGAPGKATVGKGAASSVFRVSRFAFRRAVSYHMDGWKEFVSDTSQGTRIPAAKEWRSVNENLRWSSYTTRPIAFSFWYFQLFAMFFNSNRCWSRAGTQQRNSVASYSSAWGATRKGDALPTCLAKPFAVARLPTSGGRDVRFFVPLRVSGAYYAAVP